MSFLASIKSRNVLFFFFRKNNCQFCRPYGSPISRISLLSQCFQLLSLIIVFNHIAFVTSVFELSHLSVTWTKNINSCNFFFCTSVVTNFNILHKGSTLFKSQLSASIDRPFCVLYKGSKKPCTKVFKHCLRSVSEQQH